MYRVMPLGAFIKQPKLKPFDDSSNNNTTDTDDVVSIVSNSTTSNNNSTHHHYHHYSLDDAEERYQQQLRNYVVLMNRISSDVATIGNLGCEAAIYIRFYYVKRYNTMPYNEFKKLFVGNVTISNNINVGDHSNINYTTATVSMPPDFGALIRHLCIGEASLSIQQNTNVMDADYAALRRRANIKHKYNIKLRTNLLNDLVEKYTWFFRQHVIQSAKLLMITYYEEFYGRFVPSDDDLTLNENIENINTKPSNAKRNHHQQQQQQQHQQQKHNKKYQYELLNVDILIAALFTPPGRTRNTDSMMLTTNRDRILYKNYQSFFFQMFPEDTLMHDLDVYWYKYVPFLLKIQETLINARPQTPVEILFPCFSDTRHLIKYDDRAIIDLLNATNLYVPTLSRMQLATTPPPLSYGAATLHAGDSIPQWGKLTRRHCQEFFECGNNQQNIKNNNPLLFCNFVTDGVICHRMLVPTKDECRSKPTSQWSNNCCSHQYSTKRQLLSLDEFHNPSLGHFSIYNYGTHLIHDYNILAEDKLLRIQAARLKMSGPDSTVNSLCTKCRHFVF